MGQKNPKGSVTVQNAAGRIRLRWRYGGTRYSLSLSRHTKSNLLYAKKVAQQIEQDMVFHQFDTTLKKYRVTDTEEGEVKKNIVQYFEEWVKEYKQVDCEANIDYFYLRSAIKKWGTVTEENVVALLNQEKYAPKTYNSRLSILRNFGIWLVKRSVWTANPLEEVSRRKNKKLAMPNRVPFNKAEIDAILHAFKHNTCCSPTARYKHSFYFPFIYFMFKTGVRNAEAIGLRVLHVDYKNNRLYIKETLARSIKGTNAAARKRKDTKNGKERVLPLTNDLIEILLPLTSGRGDDEIVFTSFTGLPIDDRMFQRRVFKPILNSLGIPERVLYACRHTFGSRCIDEGIDPVMTAFLMGNNPETALRSYVHQLKIPPKLPEL